MTEMDRTGEDKGGRRKGESEGGQLVSLALTLQRAFHLHVFIKPGWTVVSSKQQWTYSPGFFLATFHVFAVFSPLGIVALPQETLVLVRGKVVTLWSRRG